MTHKPFTDWLLDDAPLSGAQQIELTAHLAQCAECRALRAGWQAAERMLLAEPAAEPRPGFSGRFRARLIQRRSRPRLVWGGFALGLGAVAAAAAILPAGVAVLLAAARAAQQPAARAALWTGLSATATVTGSVADALLVAVRALFNWALTQPWLLLVLVVGLALGLAVSAAWLYLVRKFVPAR